MTYCVGWITGDAVCLVADTLRTQHQPPGSARSSMNEAHHQVGAMYVEESLLKLVELGNGIACALAGDVSRAFDIIDFIRQHIALFDSPESLFESVNKNFQVGDERLVGLLLAWTSSTSAPLLVKWDSASGHVERGQLFQIGSINAEHRELTRLAITMVKTDLGREPSVMLITVIACLQSYGLHYDLLAESVGGAVCGICVVEGLTMWQHDTMTMIYGSDGIEGYLATHFRDGVLMLNSSYQHLFTLLVNQNWGDRTGRAAQWREHWGHALEQYVPKRVVECLHWIFLSRIHHTVTVVLVRAPSFDAGAPFSAREEDGRLVIEHSSNFDAALRRGAPRHPEMARIEIDLRIIAAR
jgi:hypothetical protein